MIDLPSLPSLRRVLLAAAGGALVLLALPQHAVAQEAAPAVQVPDTADAVVQVRGMMCSNCARRMKGALEDLDEVDRATVLLEKQTALLTFVSENAPSANTLREAVTRAGYEFRGAVLAKEQKTGDSGG